MDNVRKKRIFIFSFVFLMSFFICILVTKAYVQNKSRLEYVEMEHLASIKANKVITVISKLLYKTQTLSSLVIQNNGEIQNFEQTAATIIDDPAIRNVIIAPNGIVSNVYPMEGNEKALGLNYFLQGDGNKEAVMAKESSQLVLGGPFTLVQGGQALVGRLPVYIGDEKKFWGLVSVTLNYPEALDGAELEQLQNQGFAYEIWRISPDNDEKQIIASSNYDYNKKANYVEHQMNILNANWYFRLSPIKSWYQYPETWIYTFTGILISFLISFLVIHNYDLNKMKMELEDLTYRDSLTGILNRRGLFNFLDEFIKEQNKKFVLCYIDLNKFKSINDTFGHNIGDCVLQKFAHIIKKHINEQDYLFSRMGGDEFILVFKNIDDTKYINKFFSNIYKETSKLSIIGCPEKINLTFSIGKAVYPYEGDDIDILIGIADNEMYKEKIGNDN